MAEDIVGVSTTTLPWLISWECGQPTIRTQQHSRTGIPLPSSLKLWTYRRLEEAPPLLLMFIMSPGGSQVPEGGWQVKPRTFCSFASLELHSVPLNLPDPPQDLGPGSLWTMGEQEGHQGTKKPLHSEDLPGAKESEHQRAGTCLWREKQGGMALAAFPVKYSPVRWPLGLLFLTCSPEGSPLSSALC